MKTALAVKSVAGAIAGLVGLTLTYPLEYAKVQIQNKRYTSFPKAITSTMRTEGFFKLFTGYSGSVRFIPWEKATKLVVNDSLRNYAILKKFGTNPDNSLKISTAAACGAAAGASQVLLTTPMERLRVMSIDNKLDYKQAKEILSSSKTWYRGFVPTLSRDILFSAIFFPLNALMVPWLAQMQEKFGLPVVPSVNKVLAGCLPSALACVLVTPIDGLKTRVQRPLPSNFEGAYAGLRHFPRFIKEVGVKGLFTGAMPRSVAASAFGSVCMVVDACPATCMRACLCLQHRVCAWRCAPLLQSARACCVLQGVVCPPVLPHHVTPPHSPSLSLSHSPQCHRGWPSIRRRHAHLRSEGFLPPQLRVLLPHLSSQHPTRGAARAAVATAAHSASMRSTLGRAWMHRYCICGPTLRNVRQCRHGRWCHVDYGTAQVAPQGRVVRIQYNMCDQTTRYVMQGRVAANGGAAYM